MNDRVTEYAQAVVNNQVKYCCKLHILACQRHLNDLKRQGTEDFEYVWNAEAAENILKFAETLTIKEGFKQKPVKLIPSQIFDLGCTFGWLRTNGYRRFRRRYKSVARQNGKSFENGIMGPYIAAFSGYQDGLLFTAATKKRQSKIAWNEMRKFIEVDNDLKEYFKIQDYISTITALNTGCKIEALSKEGGLDDGFRAIFTSLDELHQHKDNSIYSALYKGTRNLPETLLSIITTRGKNPRSFCKEFDDYCIKVLQGIIVADDIFVDIFTLDDGDNIYKLENILKANPLYIGDEEKIKNILVEAETAKNMGGQEKTDYIVKSLNMWATNSDNSYISPEDLKKCAIEESLENYKGYECYVGLDLSSGGDLTSFSIEVLAGESLFFDSHSYMPRGRFAEHLESDLVPYDLWEQDGLITVTGSDSDYKNDYKFIIEDLKRLKQKYNLKFRGIGIDPHNADGILSELEDFGCDVFVITQSARNLNDATVDLRLLIKSGKIRYNAKNTLLEYSFANAVTVKNSFDEIKIEKRDFKNTNRIDPVDACIDSHYLAMKNKNSEIINSQAEIEKYIKEMGWL